MLRNGPADIGSPVITLPYRTALSSPATQLHSFGFGRQASAGGPPQEMTLQLEGRTPGSGSAPFNVWVSPSSFLCKSRSHVLGDLVVDAVWAGDGLVAQCGFPPGGDLSFTSRPLALRFLPSAVGLSFPARLTSASRIARAAACRLPIGDPVDGSDG